MEGEGLLAARVRASMDTVMSVQATASEVLSTESGHVETLRKLTACSLGMDSSLSWKGSATAYSEQRRGARVADGQPLRKGCAG
jgi:hypothetical protein